MKFALLFPLVVLVGSSVVAQNIPRDPEEAVDVSMTEASQKEDLLNSPMMMWERVGESESENVSVHRKEFRGGQETRSLVERSKDLPCVEVPTFRQIIGNRRFEDHSLIGHTTGEEGGRYVAMDNNLYCLSDCLSQDVKTYLTTKEQQDQQTWALQKIKEDWEASLRKYLEDQSKKLGQSSTDDSQISEWLTSFYRFEEEHRYGFTKEQFLQFCKDNNIVTSYVSPASTATTPQGEDEESRFISVDDHENSKAPKRKNYGSIPTTEAFSTEPLSFNKEHVTELLLLIDQFKQQESNQGRWHYNPIDRYKFFASMIRSSSDVSEPTKQLFFEFHNRLPNSVATKQNSWIFQALREGEEIPPLEEVIKKINEIMAPNANETTAKAVDEIFQRETNY